VLAEAQKLMSAPPALPEPQDDPFATGEVSEQWITALIDRKDQQDRLQRRRAILLELIESARARSAAAAAEVRDQILHGYDRELRSLLSDVEAVAEELGGVDSAEDAVAADRAPQWKRLRELADDYGVLRMAQRKLMDPEAVTRSQPTNGGEEPASDLHIRNLDDVWPEWRSGGARDGVTVSNFGGGGEHRYEPWPADPVRFLLWLVTSEVQAWVPTHEQLRRLWADRQDPMPTRESAGPVQRTDPFNRLATPIGNT
jgi:hypothetical protein